MIIKSQHPIIYNKIVELCTRFIVKNKFSDKDYNKLYHNIIAFSTFFYLNESQKMDIGTIFIDNYNLEAYKAVKKFTIVILIRLLLSNNLNVNSIKNILIPTIIGYYIYFIYIEKYIDRIIEYYKLGNNLFFKNLNKILPHLFESIIYEELNVMDIDIHIKDLFGRFLYNSTVKNYLNFV